MNDERIVLPYYYAGMVGTALKKIATDNAVFAREFLPVRDSTHPPNLTCVHCSCKTLEEQCYQLPAMFLVRRNTLCSYHTH